MSGVRARKPIWGWLAAVHVLAILVAACSPQGTLTIRDAWARPARMGENTAVYFMIENLTGLNDSLLEAEAAVAAGAELHRTMMVDEAATQAANGNEGEHEGGEAENPFGSEVMQMMRQDRVELPAGAIIQFEPGGLHIMLLDLKEDLTEGQTLLLVLQFEQVGAVQVEVPIENR